MSLTSDLINLNYNSKSLYLLYTKMDTASTEQRVIVSDKYPVPDTIDAINVKEGTRYEKDHLTISANYKVINR